MKDFNSRKEMIEVNLGQEKYYDQEVRKGRLTVLWDSLRNKALDGLRTKINAKSDIYSIHRSWLGDLTDKRVLDLGCYAGNEISLHMAKHSKEYLGIDLSQKGIDSLNEKLNRKSLKSARAIRIDFLSPDFDSYGKFDIIYVYSALHHFKYFDVVLERLTNFLNEGGIVITYDPLQTYWLMRVLRKIYRPFQSDAAWEFPFDKRSLTTISKYFNIVKCQGILNKTKWAFILNFLPISSDRKSEILERWHKTDLEKAIDLNHHLFGSLHLTMLLQKKNN